MANCESGRVIPKNRLTWTSTCSTIPSTGHGSARASGCAPNLFRHEAFDQIVEERIAPSDDVLGDDDALDSWMKREVITAHHVSSTCKMGPSNDQLAVVDQYGKVYGVDGLRVIDASIMPDTVRANLNLNVIAMAERAVGLINRNRH